MEPEMNHCGKSECPAAEELREALAEEKISDEIVRDVSRAVRQGEVWERLFSEILRVPT